MPQPGSEHACSFERAAPAPPDAAEASELVLLLCSALALGSHSHGLAERLAMRDALSDADADAERLRLRVCAFGGEKQAADVRCVMESDVHMDCESDIESGVQRSQ